MPIAVAAFQVRAREFGEIAVDLGTVAPHDDLAIRQQGALQDAQEHAALLRALRIVPADGKPASATCERMAPA